MPEVRQPAVAGVWYPGTAAALAAAVDGYLAAATARVDGELLGLIAPHAGLPYSGPVAAHAYRLLCDRTFDVIAIVGPSHFVAFDGVAAPAVRGFATPYGVTPVAADVVADLLRAHGVVHERPGAHAREHSIEMQLPFLGRVAPVTPIVPLVMGRQTPETATALAEALVSSLRGRRALLVASTDLSHYHAAAVAARLDAVVLDHVSRFDASGLQRALVANPDHACGGGPAVAVMHATAALGARAGLVLDYADSGDVSGDKSSVVGYMAAALGTRP